MDKMKVKMTMMEPESSGESLKSEEVGAKANIILSEEEETSVAPFALEVKTCDDKTQQESYSVEDPAMPNERVQESTEGSETGKNQMEEET